MTDPVTDRLRNLPTVATCPWCGHARRVYIRAGSELVCATCAQQAQAIEATQEDSNE